MNDENISCLIASMSFFPSPTLTAGIRYGDLCQSRNYSAVPFLNHFSFLPTPSASLRVVVLSLISLIINQIVSLRAVETIIARYTEGYAIVSTLFALMIGPLLSLYLETTLASFN